MPGLLDDVDKPFNVDAGTELRVLFMYGVRRQRGKVIDNVNIGWKIGISHTLIVVGDCRIEVLGCPKILIMSAITSLSCARWFATFEPIKPAPPVTETRLFRMRRRV